MYNRQWVNSFPLYGCCHLFGVSIIRGSTVYKNHGLRKYEVYTLLLSNFIIISSCSPCPSPSVCRNPVGRTGMIGRGLLGRWGPNHAADPVVTR